ncbi:ABC transporter permease [Cohnella silvisoli]|uniref:ABC-2 family transporter protein n=1 Tax=Cohnella silvisoli TaxID=2873699 RepID=A0ABV1KPP1_9BACL|nr:ABC-2 family transporter protein [Cohnella silvisoli]MCD9025580.1 ABC-2 family transporter protein [Cohnella silvisoli]
MRLYWEIFKRSFQSAAAYRLEMIAQTVSSLFGILIQTSIWLALYRGNAEHASTAGQISIRDMLTYAILSSCVFLLINNQMIWKLGEKIKTGEIAMDLIKPIHLARYLFSESGGLALFRVVFQLLPVLAFGAVIYGIVPPAAPDFVFFAVCLLNGIVLYYLMSFICGLIAFWYMVNWHTNSLFHLVMTLFSGSLVPLWFFPGALSKTVSLLPFPLVFYGPISVYLGKRTIEEEMVLVAMQFAWIALLALLLRWIWGKAVKKLVIQGG